MDNKPNWVEYGTLGVAALAILGGLLHYLLSERSLNAVHSRVEQIGVEVGAMDAELKRQELARNASELLTVAGSLSKLGETTGADKLRNVGLTIDLKNPGSTDLVIEEIRVEMYAATLETDFKSPQWLALDPSGRRKVDATKERPSAVTASVAPADVPPTTIVNEDGTVTELTPARSQNEVEGSDGSPQERAIDDRLVASELRQPDTWGDRPTRLRIIDGYREDGWQPLDVPWTYLPDELFGNAPNAGLMRREQERTISLSFAVSDGEQSDLLRAKVTVTTAKSNDPSAKRRSIWIGVTGAGRLKDFYSRKRDPDEKSYVAPSPL